MLTPDFTSVHSAIEEVTFSALLHRLEKGTVSSMSRTVDSEDK